MRRRLEENLRRRIDFSCKSGRSTVDDMVSYLHSEFPEYRRMKRQTLTTLVRQAMESSPRISVNGKRNADKPVRSPLKFEPGDDEDGAFDDKEETGRMQTRKRLRRKIDQSEEKLQRIEDLHFRRIQRNRTNDSAASSSNSSVSESEEDEVNGAVSTSEDAVYGEEVKPEFDLMKTMLRSKYNKGAAEKTQELEVANENNSNKIRVVNLNRGDGMLGSEVKREAENSSASNFGGGGGGDCDSKVDDDGPRFKDLGGMKEVLEELKMEVIVPLCHPQLLRWLGVRPMAGILLHGPPGCGKTKLAHAIAKETGVPFYKISATEVVSGVSGASEENIRELFAKAYRTAPSIVFIDEIDAIASKRDNLQREMEKRIVTQLMTCMDESHRTAQPDDGKLQSGKSDQSVGYVLVIGATNRPDAVDPALRRPGRFDREIVLGVPDENARAEILSILTRNLRLEGSFDLPKIAKSTSGFVGADLTALVNKAGNLAMKRIIDERKCELSQESIVEPVDEWWRKPWSLEEMDKLSIEMSDFENAVKLVQPSLRREGFSSIPTVKWEDVGGLDLLRKEFERCIVKRIKYSELYKEFGIGLETGFLLYGPPGCGKTLIAKAVANEAGANFIHVKGPELLNKYVGESELAVRILFSRARTCSPCIIFFDEVDALATKRGKEGGWVVERLLNQLLIELDGSEQRHGVFVIGATNRPEVMDVALLRPGRFGKLLYVPLPSADERGLILKALARRKNIDPSVDLSTIGKLKTCENLSGADLTELMEEAAMLALEDLTSAEGNSKTARTIKATHIERALSKISPSVSQKQNEYYQMLSKSLKAT